jgi:hypothetical protein
VWLAITYKSNFANFAAANGWLGRAERLLEPYDPGPLHGWVQVARAYRMTDLDQAEQLAEQAARIARAARDVDLELVALSQIGLIRVGKGQADAGFALIDEAMAAALAGERSNLDTVVYACCDMLNACELVSDIERAAQWCKVADDFVARYGCPFLFAECRIFYGSVLAAKGRWADAERELDAGLRITDGACPGLHSRPCHAWPACACTRGGWRKPNRCWPAWAEASKPRPKPPWSPGARHRRSARDSFSPVVHLRAAHSASVTVTASTWTP